MKKNLILVLAGILLSASPAFAQTLWNGDPLPPAWGGDAPVVDPYFVPSDVNDVNSLSEFDGDAGTDFSRKTGASNPLDVTEANGWVDASLFSHTLMDGATLKFSWLGDTAAALNDFGINLGGTNVSGAGAFTLLQDVGLAGFPAYGTQWTYTNTSGGSMDIDFWLNSNEPTIGGVYSIFNPATSIPEPSGVPNYNYSARAMMFNVVDDAAGGINRSILVVAIEDWRTFDADFTDLFFAIEGFAVPEPSTYGLLGAVALLGLIAARKLRR
jgi:hypothetical protein